MSHGEKATDDLVREFNQGQDREENARLLFKRYYGHVFRFFRSKRLSPEDCAELTEDVFFSVYNRLGELRQVARFENWLFKIARNIYKNELERRAAKKRTAAEVLLGGGRADSEEIQLPAPPSANPEILVLEKERLEQVRQALQKLPDQMRRCLLLRVDNELSYREIALVMGLSINTVSVHLHQARKTLIERLGGYVDDL